MSIFQAWVVKGIRFWWQFLDAVSTVPQNLWVDHLFAEFGFYPSSRNIWSFFGGTISHGTLKARFVSGRLACKSKISMGCPIKVSGSILYPNSSGIQIALPAKSSDEATKRPCGETTSDFETNTYHSWLTQWFLYLPDSEVGCFATANAGHKWHAKRPVFSSFGILFSFYWTCGQNHEFYIVLFDQFFFQEYRHEAAKRMPKLEASSRWVLNNLHRAHSCQPFRPAKFHFEDICF